MILRVFQILLVVSLVLGFGYFVIDLYTVPDSEYVESISQGEVNQVLHLRFVSDSETRAEVDAYGIYIDGQSEPSELNQMDARLPRQSIGYPPDEDTVTLVLWASEGEVLETHEVDLA